MKPETYRLGYGSPDGSADALEELDEIAKKLGEGRMVCHQDGIRIGILISDSRACIFAPTALLIESSTESINRPNGVIIEPVPANILKEVGLGDRKEADQAIGLDKVMSSEIKKVVEDIKKNPPQKFDVARKVRVFNARFEFVELKIEGCFLSRHKVTIPSELMGLAGDANMQKRLRSSFQLITGDEIFGEKDTVNEKKIVEERKKIEDKWLGNITGYGKAVLRENKDDLNKDIEELRKIVKKYSDAIKEKLKKSIEANVNSLAEQLLPGLKTKFPDRWKKDMGKDAPEEKMKKRLIDEIGICFRDADNYIKEMKVEVIYKNVSYESLQNKEFIEAAQKAFPYLEVLHEEHDALQGNEVEKSLI